MLSPFEQLEPGIQTHKKMTLFPGFSSSIEQGLVFERWWLLSLIQPIKSLVCGIVISVSNTLTQTSDLVILTTMFNFVQYFLIIMNLLIVFMFRVLLQFIHKLGIYSERFLVFIYKASILCNISIFFYQLRCQNCGEETKDWVYMCLIVS